MSDLSNFLNQCHKDLIKIREAKDNNFKLLMYAKDPNIYDRGREIALELLKQNRGEDVELQ